MTLRTPIPLTPSEALLPPPALPSRVLCSFLSPYSPWVISSTFSFQLHPSVASESPEYISSLGHHAQSFIPMAPTVYWTSSPASYKTLLQTHRVPNEIIFFPPSLYLYLSRSHHCAATHPAPSSINHHFPLILTPKHILNPFLYPCPNISQWNHYNNLLSGLPALIFPLPLQTYNSVWYGLHLTRKWLPPINSNALVSQTITAKTTMNNTISQRMWFNLKCCPKALS